MCPLIESLNSKQGTRYQLSDHKLGRVIAKVTYKRGISKGEFFGCGPTCKPSSVVH